MVTTLQKESPPSRDAWRPPFQDPDQCFPPDTQGEGPVCDFHELVQAAECIILCRTCDGRITFLNRYGLQFFGFEAEEIIGKHVIGTIVPHTDSAGRDLEQMIAAIGQSPEEYVSNENENICKDGRRVWISWRNKAVRDKAGGVRGLLCVGTDRTDQRMAVEQLRQYEERFRTVFEKATDGMLLIECGEKCVSAANNMACRMLGYCESDLVGRPVSDVLPSREWDQVSAVFKNCADNVTDAVQGLALRRKDGSVLYADLSLWTLSVSGQTYLAGLLRDVTRHREAERALSREHAFRRAVETSLRPGILAFDLDGRQTYVGHAFCDMLGWEPVDLLDALPPYRYLRPEDARQLVPARAQILSGEVGRSTRTLNMFRRDGSTFTGLAIGAPLKSEDGTMLGWVASVADLTDRQQTSERISRLNDCFLGFGIDPAANIQRLVEVAGKIMNADCAIYNRRNDHEMRLIAGWQLPADSLLTCAKATSGHLCAKVVRDGGEDVFVKHELEGGACLFGFNQHCSPKMRTYVGKALKVEGEYSGVLCTLFRREVEPSQEEKRLLGVIATAIGVEEARQADTAQLVENRLKLRALTSQLAVTEQRERRRIAHVLHDDVGQLLATACLKLNTVPDLREPAAIRAEVTEIGKLIRSATSHTRSLTSQVSLEFLQGVGLYDAVRSECERLERHHGVACSIEEDGSSADLDGELATLLFQVIRELLFNVVKHAHARNVSIDLERRGADFRVCVSDDGVGFSPSKRPAAVTSEGGFGLFSNSERLQYIGGRLDIDSVPGEGTTVTLVAPFDFSGQVAGSAQEVTDA